ncbi:hypothetical protein IWZ01DRAFT_575421 [Phyllosticta capitalensis]
MTRPLVLPMLLITRLPRPQRHVGVWEPQQRLSITQLSHQRSRISLGSESTSMLGSLDKSQTVFLLSGNESRTRGFQRLPSSDHELPDLSVLISKEHVGSNVAPSSKKPIGSNLAASSKDCVQSACVMPSWKRTGSDIATPSNKRVHSGCVTPSNKPMRYTISRSSHRSRVDPVPATTLSADANWSLELGMRLGSKRCGTHRGSTKTMQSSRSSRRVCSGKFLYKYVRIRGAVKRLTNLITESTKSFAQSYKE